MGAALADILQPVNGHRLTVSAIDNVAYEELIPISPSLRVGTDAFACFAAISAIAVEQFGITVCDAFRVVGADSTSKDD